MINIGSVVTKAAFKKFYRYKPDHCISHLLLHGYLKLLPRNKGERRKYEVVKPLPEDVKSFLDLAYTTTVGSLVETAYSIFEDLAGELQDWLDSMPENLLESDKAQLLQESIDALTSIDQPDIPQNLADVQVIYYPFLNPSSRKMQCNSAVDMISAAIDSLDGIESEELDEVLDDLNEIMRQAEDVEFPGLYG